MPFRSRSTLEHWVESFVSSRGAGHGARVLVQDGSDGRDTGLVVVALSHTTSTVYLEPAETGSLQWTITVEPQPEPQVLTSLQMHALAAECQVIAELCTFLETRSLSHVEAPPAP